MTKTFFVPGIPQTKGNLTAMIHRHTGRAIMVEGRKNKYRKAFRRWMSDVERYALATFGPVPLVDVPVTIDLTFYVPRPKSAKKRTKPHVKPDWDKLSRAVCDALTGVVYHDDGQITDAAVRKRYADCGDYDGPGVQVMVAPDGETQ